MDDKAEKLCQDDHKVDYPCGSYIKSTKRKGTVPRSNVYEISFLWQIKPSSATENWRLIHVHYLKANGANSNDHCVRSELIVAVERIRNRPVTLNVRKKTRNTTGKEYNTTWGCCVFFQPPHVL